MADELDQIKNALNRHGVFLKKATLEKIPARELEIFEEVGSSFGGTRVADIVAVQHFPDRNLYFVIECKRVASERRWIFFRHKDVKVRVARQIGAGQPPSEFQIDPAGSCSEGFEYPFRSKSDDPTAEQDPVYRAASQLSAAYLGFVQDHWRNRGSGLPEKGERFVPVLVTTARLSVVQNVFEAAPLSTGRLGEKLVLKDLDEVILKHPFPTPEGVNDDFRHKTAADPWHHRYTESLYVTRAESLGEFFSEFRREALAGL
jgi:hypothetical protein